MEIRVLIADDCRSVRKGIRFFLEETEDIRVIGEACNGEEAVQLVKRLMPDVLLLDAKMPGSEGIQVLSNLREFNFPGRVLVVSAYYDRQNILSMLNGGADGYLTKEDPKELIKAIRSVSNGDQNWISPWLKQILPARS